MNNGSNEKAELMTSDKTSSASVIDFVVALQQMSAKMEPFLEGLSEALLRFSQAIKPFVERIAQLIEAFARYEKFVKSVGSTGWLPYHTLSIGYVEECGEDVALIDRRVSEYYRNSWNAIRQDIESRLDEYHIREETRETFREALGAHEAGYHRCVCSTLFPVIDREFRIHFFQDTAGSVSSKQMLETLTNRGSLSDFMPREAYGWILFDRLVQHLYEGIDNSNKAKYEQDHVPNRHAAMHGLLSYSTHKHSMNMIIMTDYIFQVLTATVRLPSPQQ